MNWTTYLLNLARAVATKSKDRSTKVGCVIVDSEYGVLSTGYNGMPRGVDDDVAARHERPEKYLWVTHAEANAVAQAAKKGTSLSGATAVVTHAPCCHCMSLLIQAGVKKVAYDGSTGTSMDPHMFKVASVMCEEAGVSFTAVTNT